MMRVYAVYDCVSETWAAPQVSKTDGDAARAFAFSCAAANVPMSYLKDICLYDIGTFDELTGVITGSNPVIVVRGDSEFVRNYFGGSVNEISEEENGN